MRKSIRDSLREVVRPRPFFITSPELATVGQGCQAYMERFTVISIGIACITFSYFNFYGDCRLLTALIEPSEEDSTLSNVTETIDSIFSDLGIEGFYSVNKDWFRDNFPDWRDFESVHFGHHGFAAVRKNETESWMREYECKGWDPYMDFIESKETPSEIAFWDWIIVFANLSPVLGILGVLCATVETLFAVFYPSILAGAVFLSAAAFAEIIWLLLYLAIFKSCIEENWCFFDRNFYTCLFVICGYCFASCLLVFGLRAYPLCLLKNRDPKNCRVIDPEILCEEDIPETHPTRPSEASAPMDGSTLKAELQNAKEDLLRSEEARCQALARAEKAEARAEKAEALLRRYTEHGRDSNGDEKKWD